MYCMQNTVRVIESRETTVGANDIRPNGRSPYGTVRNSGDRMQKPLFGCFWGAKFGKTISDGF
jgi:hypothetical protein